MNLGNLGVKLSVDMGGYSSSMDQAERKAKTSMTAASGSVDDFRSSLLQASSDIQRVAQSIGTNMEAANDAIISNSDKSVKSIEQVADAADKADFQPMSERIAAAVGKGIGAGIVAAEKGWDSFVEYSKTKAIVVGLAVSAIFAAVGLGAIYTAYKVIAGSLGFITGLLTGDSYKSENIDALIEANNQVKEIQSSLVLTAQQAAATNAALAALGVDKPAYISTFTAAAGAIRENTDELDRLGVAYKDAQGNLLPLSDVVQSANAVLQSYTEGWDRNKAATAIGLGSAAEVAAAASVTAGAIAAARERLNDYNLGIGPESQAAVKAYQDAMRDFNRETDLTSQGFKRAIADNIMPLLTDLAVFFKDGFPSAVNAFRYSMAVVTTLFYGLKEAIYVVAESILGSIQAMATGIGALGLAAGRALTGDFSGAKDALVQGWTDAKDRMAQIGANIVAQHQHNAAAVRQAWAMDDRTADGVAAAKGKAWVPAPKEEAEKPAVTDPFAKDMMSLDRTKAGIDYVIANFDKFQGKVKESKAAMAEFDVTLGKYSDLQRQNDGFSPLTASQKATYVAKNQLIDQGIEKERQLQVLRKLDNSADQFTFKEQQSLEFRKQDVEWMGKSQLEIAKLTEARRIDGEVAAMLNQTQIELGKQGLQISDAQIASINARADAAKAASQALIEQQDAKNKDPWFNATESIRKYGEEAANVGLQIGTAMTNAAKGMEDAIVKFVTTGKLSFGDLAKAVISDIARMQARAAVSGIFSALGNLAASYFGGGSAEPSGSTNGGVIDADARGSYATGGYVSGPGTGTSDDVSAWLSNGEFVMNAEATKRNHALLERLNNGGKAANAPHFATGGYVGQAGAMSSPAASGGDINIYTDVKISDSGVQSTTRTDNGNDLQKQLAGMIDMQIEQVLIREQRQGGILWKMQNSFGRAA